MAAQDPLQLADLLRQRLKSYLTQINTVNANLKDINQIQTELDVDHKPLSLIQGRLHKAYDLLGANTDEELACVCISFLSFLNILTLSLRP
jgi:hypothetical protein